MEGLSCFLVVSCFQVIDGHVVGGQRSRCQDMNGTILNMCTCFAHVGPSRTHVLRQLGDFWPTPMSQVIVNAANRTEEVAIEKTRLYLSLGVAKAKIPEKDMHETCFICLKAHLMRADGL